MNETIVYDKRLPTLGYHRPLWAKYGEYTFLPPQRWLHNIEHGAIVGKWLRIPPKKTFSDFPFHAALYHPCANKNQVEKLKKIVKGCLFKHIITPYKNLTSDRPFAIAAWANSIEFSVVNEVLVKKFIKEYALTGPERTPKDGQYLKLLIEAASALAENDEKICP